MNISVSEITKKYRAQKNISLREFARSISDGVPESVTYQTVANWEQGVFSPKYAYLLMLALHNNDWRRDFALECLAVLKPEYYAADIV